MWHGLLKHLFSISQATWPDYIPSITRYFDLQKLFFEMIPVESTCDNNDMIRHFFVLKWYFSSADFLWSRSFVTMFNDKQKELGGFGIKIVVNHDYRVYSVDHRRSWPYLYRILKPYIKPET